MFGTSLYVEREARTSDYLELESQRPMIPTSRGRPSHCHALNAILVGNISTVGPKVSWLMKAQHLHNNIALTVASLYPFVYL